MKACTWHIGYHSSRVSNDLLIVLISTLISIDIFQKYDKQAKARTPSLERRHLPDHGDCHPSIRLSCHDCVDVVMDATPLRYTAGIVFWLVPH